jgi:hypothetical protein
MKTNAKIETLRACMDHVNGLYADNIEFKRLDVGRWITFTLKVKDSKNPGSRRNAEGKRIAAACWHVHGNFIDRLFKLEPSCVLWSVGKKYDSFTWRWEDRNIGSIVRPFYFSEACNC